MSQAWLLALLAATIGHLPGFPMLLPDQQLLLVLPLLPPLPPLVPYHSRFQPREGLQSLKQSAKLFPSRRALALFLPHLEVVDRPLDFSSGEVPRLDLFGVASTCGGSQRYCLFVIRDE